VDQPGPVDYDAELRLDRLPGLRLDPAAEDPHIHGLIFRSPSNLPVRFDPT
jgi:hypothetical protein